MKALLRIAVVYNIPIANNRSSADFIISPPLMPKEYSREIVDYDEKISRVKKRVIPYKKL